MGFVGRGALSTFGGGLVGGGMSALTGGNFWSGAMNGAIGGAVGFVANEVSAYVKQTRAQQKYKREKLGLSKQQVKALRRYGLGKINLKEFEGENATKIWNELKAEHTHYNELTEYLTTKDYDPEAIIKEGRMHLRYGSEKMVNKEAYQLNTVGKMNVHYDRFDVVLFPVLHLLFDTGFQATKKVN